MRIAKRLLASVKPERFLEGGSPTGLTGLTTHVAPRPVLLFLYRFTLDELKTFPEHSVYRQAAEAITRHRMNIVEAIKPPGFEEWEKMTKEKRKTERRRAEEASKAVDEDSTAVSNEQKPSRRNPITSIRSMFKRNDEEIDDEEEWDGEKEYEGSLEGPRTATEQHSHRASRAKQVKSQAPKFSSKDFEPPLEATQIAEIEEKIGAGLIEEVIQVAEGELKLALVMGELKVWEELEEKSPPGQWEYFARDQHTQGTQEPPT